MFFVVFAAFVSTAPEDVRNLGRVECSTGTRTMDYGSGPEAINARERDCSHEDVKTHIIFPYFCAKVQCKSS